MSSVTIALCTYNGSRYLEEQLNSLQAQTMADFDVVVSDDASNDGTWEILERYAAADPRFRLMRNSTSRGVQRNFEAAIMAARGDWIAPCDQDDIWEPEKLAILLDAVRAPDVVMAYSDSALIDAEGKPLGIRAFQTRVAIDGGAPLVFAFDNCVSGHAMIFHRRLLDIALPFPERPMYDWWLAAAATSIGRIVRIDQPLVRYRQHAGNVTDIAGLRKRRLSHAQKKAERAGLTREREIAERLAVFSRLPGPTGAAYRQLSLLWERRATQFFSWELAYFAWINRDRMWAIRPQKLSRYLKQCFRMFKGGRLKPDIRL